VILGWPFDTSSAGNDFWSCAWKNKNEETGDESIGIQVNVGSHRASTEYKTRAIRKQGRFGRGGWKSGNSDLRRFQTLVF
jgi:hypothetical protein